MFEVCKLFGPKAVFFMFNDDKTRVPLDFTAASLQAPLLMHMEYKIKLMDNDLFVGPQHKLIQRKWKCILQWRHFHTQKKWQTQYIKCFYTCF